MQNLAEDMKRGGGGLAITQTDMGAYKVGENIATAPGKVDLPQRVFELLQYAPSTETVHETPLLIFPPWINKFYILDLQPKNSMIRWLTEPGLHGVPRLLGQSRREHGRALVRGLHARGRLRGACKPCEDATGVEHMNTVGYCIGGTLLAATLAHMAKTGDDAHPAATFFAAQSRLQMRRRSAASSPTKLASNISKTRWKTAAACSTRQTMADTFNALRSNDLIWNYVVDNYYMGKQPPPFDLLYWNADQTRMPAALHLFYLRKFYRDNALAEGQAHAARRKASNSAT